MESVYEIAGISRQGHHSNNQRMAAKAELQEDILRRVKQVRIIHPRMGSRPLYKMLQIEGIGINQFEKLLSSRGLGVKMKQNRHKTTDGSKYKGRLTNLLNGKKVNAINQVWVSDITYFQVNGKDFYIIIIMDVYSRRIIGCEIYENMQAKNNVAVLKQALKVRSQEKYDNKLIHHSDRGSQYMSLEYKALLREREIDLSVAFTSLENGYAERINATIKNDYLIFHATDDLKKLRKSLNYCVYLYNYERPHSSLRYLTPIAFERELSEQKCGEELTMYDFTQDYTIEFFEGMGQSKQNKKKGSEEPSVSTVQDYSSRGCSPAEPLSASSCLAKVITIRKHR